MPANLPVRTAKVLTTLAKAAATSKNKVLDDLSWYPGQARLRVDPDFGYVAVVTNGRWVFRIAVPGFDPQTDPGTSAFLNVDLLDGPLSDGPINSSHKIVIVDDSLLSVDGVTFNVQGDRAFPRDEFTEAGALPVEVLDLDPNDVALISAAMRRVRQKGDIVRTRFLALKYNQEVVPVIEFAMRNGIDAWIAPARR